MGAFFIQIQAVHAQTNTQQDALMAVVDSFGSQRVLGTTSGLTQQQIDAIIRLVEVFSNYDQDIVNAVRGALEGGNSINDPSVPDTGVLAMSMDSWSVGTIPGTSRPSVIGEYEISFKVRNTKGYPIWIDGDVVEGRFPQTSSQALSFVVLRDGNIIDPSNNPNHRASLQMESENGPVQAKSAYRVDNNETQTFTLKVQVTPEVSGVHNIDITGIQWGIDSQNMDRVAGPARSIKTSSRVYLRK